jgi:hypothetical protein
MTNKTKLEAIRTWVLRCCPDLLELKPGCLVEWDGDVCMLLAEGKAKDGLKGMFQIMNVNGSGVICGDVEDENGKVIFEDCPAYVDSPWDKVLGQPLGLTEMLRAMGTMKPSHLHSSCVIRTSFWLRSDLGEAEWNLLEGLEKQKPDVIDFFYKLSRLK